VSLRIVRARAASGGTRAFGDYAQPVGEAICPPLAFRQIVLPGDQATSLSQMPFWTRLSMNPADISALAHHLFEAQGAKAIAEAAHKALSFEKARDKEQARFWHQVEAVLREIRGPRQS
jgi:hypothetical protein